MTVLSSLVSPSFSPSFLASAAGSLLALSILLGFIMPLFGRNKMPVDGRVVVVTGGSQGMGKSVAIQLAKNGASIAIIARTQSKLDAALEEIQAAGVKPSQKFMAVSADLCSGPENERALEEVKKYMGVPDIVWQCAGGTHPGFFKDYTSEQLEQEMKANYFTAMHTAHAAMKMMTASPKTEVNRRIIFTSSIAAFYPLAGYNAYTPTKAAMRALADGLRQECILYDIDVSICFPGTIFTPGFEEEQKTKPELTKILEGADAGQTPEEVADICIRKLEKGQQMITTAFLSHMMMAGSWGPSPKGVLETLFAMIVQIIFSFVGPIMDMDVYKYKKKLAAEGKTV